MAQKMLRPGTLALRNLKRHKRQYAAMVTGIILALVFASGLTYFSFCYKASLDAIKLDRFGAEEEIIMHTTEDVIHDAQAQGLVEKAGYAHLLGYVYSDNENRANGTTVAWLDDTAKELSNATLLTGTWPENSGEIAMEQSVLAQMGLSADIGDTINVQMQLQNGRELLNKTVKKTYVLTGILKNKRSNIASYYESEIKKDLPGAFVCAGTQTEPGGLEALACYCTLPDDGYVELRKLVLGADGEEIGNGYLISIPENVDINTSTTGIIINGRFWQTAILIGVLLFAACAAVVNAFNTNLNARKKQIGMLRAVGATKGQVIKMYGIEVLMIALLCIPVSLLISFFAVRGVIAVMDGDYIFVPNLWVLLLCGVFGLLCVLIAALIPLIGATRISPMQAIRNISTTRKMKTKRIRTQKAFRLPKLLAARRTTFSKGRQVVVSIFLTIAIIGSGYAFSLSAYTISHISHRDSDYEIYSYSSGSTDVINIRAKRNGFTESDRQTVLRLPYIESSTGKKILSVNMPIDGFTDYLNMVTNSTVYDNGDIAYGRANELTSDNYKALLWQKQLESYTKYRPYLQGDYLPLELAAVDSETLEKLSPHLGNGQIHTESIDRGEEVILLAPKQIGLYIESPSNSSYYLQYDKNGDVTNRAHDYFATIERDSDLTAGKELDLTFLFSDYLPEDTDVQGEEIDRRDAQTTIGAVLSEIPEELMGSFPGYGDMVLLTSIDGMEKLAGNTPYQALDFQLNQPCTDEIDSEVRSVLNEVTAHADDTDIVSDYEFVKLQQNDARSVLTIMLSVVIVLFVFCGAIVNNTITADIRENRRELGTLRAVGASAKELSQAYILQLFKMLGWGSAIGLFGFAGSYLIAWIVCRIKYGPNSMEFIFTPWFSILFCIVLFAACSLNLYIKIKHETKNSIVDNIRELG